MRTFQNTVAISIAQLVAQLVAQDGQIFCATRADAGAPTAFCHLRTAA